MHVLMYARMQHSELPPQAQKLTLQRHLQNEDPPLNIQDRTNGGYAKADVFYQVTVSQQIFQRCGVTRAIIREEMPMSSCIVQSSRGQDKRIYPLASLDYTQVNSHPWGAISSELLGCISYIISQQPECRFLACPVLPGQSKSALQACACTLSACRARSLALGPQELLALGVSPLQ